MFCTTDPLLELAQALMSPWRASLFEELEQLQQWCCDRLDELAGPWPQAADLAQSMRQAYEVLAEASALFLEEPEVETAEQLVEVLEAASQCLEYVRESLEDLREVTPLLA